MSGNLKKRHRSASSSRLSASAAGTGESSTDGTLIDSSQKLRRMSSFSSLTVSPAPAPHPPLPPPIPGGFNDPSTADVILRLYLEPSPFDPVSDDPSLPSASKSYLQIHVHSSVLRRAKFFGAMLSDRWMGGGEDPDSSSKPPFRLSFGVNPTTGSIHLHAVVIRLLYTDDFATAIDSVSTAVSILPIALKLLFEDCVRECVRFLESVPWSEDEEQRIVGLIPLLGEDESKELLARVSPLDSDSFEEMLHSLVLTALHYHYNVAAVKAFVARLLRDFSSMDCTRRVLERVFSKSLKVVKDSLEDYSSPDFRGDHTETEAIQRLNLHTAMSNGKHLLWIVDRMIELRVAGSAVEEWSDQASFAADLQRAFREDAWRNIVPGLPTVVLKCTCKLANAVAAGSILAPRQVRKKLVKDWLPVLIVCKDNMSPLAVHNKSILHSSKPLYLELEEAFLKIISTLPMEDSQELLQQCLSFSTRDTEECPHLVSAFSTWFRRATRMTLPFSSS